MFVAVLSNAALHIEGSLWNFLSKSLSRVAFAELQNSNAIEMNFTRHFEIL